MITRVDKIFGLAIALGTQKRIRSDIDKEYSRLETTYFKEVIALNSSKTLLFGKYAIETSEYIKQCFAIVMHNTRDNKPLVIDRLLKKAYRNVFNYYNNNKNRMVITLEEFTHDYVKKSGGLENISGLYLDYCYYTLDYLVEFRGGNLLESGLLTNLRDQLRLSIYDSTRLRLEVLNSMKGYPSNKRKKVEASIEEFTKSIESSVGLGENVSILLENLKLKDEIVLLNMGYPMVVDKDFKDMPRHKIINSLHLIANLCGIEHSFLQEADIDEGVLRGIIKSIHITAEEHNIPKRERLILFLSSLFIYSIAVEYNKLRNDHYEGLKTKTTQRELDLENKYKKELEDIQIKLSSEISVTGQLKDELNKMKSIRSSLDEEKLKMELEIKRLKEENRSLKENEKELSSLRDYFLTETVEVSNEDIPEKVLLEELNHINGVFVGGDSSLQATLQEMLPNFTFIHENDLTKDLRYIRSKDIIFTSRMSNNHGLYYKINSVIKNSDVELSHLQAKTNPNLLVKEMHSKIGVLVK